MAKLVLGSAQFGLHYGINNRCGITPVDEVYEILKFAAKNGIHEIDTAQAYGVSEEVLGVALADFKNDFILHSKFTWSDLDLVSQLDLSLRRLKIEKLGFFFFHRFEDYVKFKENFQELIPPGACAGLGVSIYRDEELIKCLDDPAIAAIQIPLNIFDCDSHRLNLLSDAKNRGKKIYVRSVFLQGLFFLDPGSLSRRIQGLREPLKILQSIARSAGISVRTLALAFVKQISFIDGVVIGVETKEQLEQNVLSWDHPVSEDVICQLKKVVVLERELLFPSNW